MRMSEDIHETLSCIQELLLKKAYNNEEQVRLSLIARLCLCLGWNVWNPRIFYPEYSVNKDGKKSRIDIVLFSSEIENPIPNVYIEINRLGTLSKQNIDKWMKQLDDYNAPKTASITILTDGQFWLFFDYTYGRGELSQKHFLTINLLDSSQKKIIQGFRTYLLKEMFPDKALSKAKIELQKIRLCSSVQFGKSHYKEIAENYPKNNQYEITQIFLADKSEPISLKDIEFYWDRDIRPVYPEMMKESKSKTSKKKPESVWVIDKWHKASNWIDIKKIVYGNLIDRIASLNIPHPYNVTKDKNLFKHALKLRDSYYAQGNLSSGAVLSHCEYILRTLGYDPSSTLRIKYAK